MKHIFRTLFLYSCLLCCMACETDVVLCYDQQQHNTPIDVTYTWTNAYAQTKPHNMRFIAIRPLNFFRYDYTTTSEASNNTVKQLYPFAEANDQTEDKKQTISLRIGEYLTAVHSSNETVFFDPLTLLENDASINHDFQDFIFTYKCYNSTELQKQEDGYAWMDYNPYSDYIADNLAPVYGDCKDRIKVTHDTQNIKLAFQPKPFTQKITFGFTLKKEEGIIVDSLVLELSGIPSAITLRNGHLRTDKTFKTRFRANYPKQETANDSAQATSLACLANTNVLGLVANTDMNASMGAGIVNLHIYTHHTVIELDEENQTEIERVIYVNHTAYINLYHSLEKQKSLKWDEFEQQYTRAKEKLNYTLSPSITIKKDEIEINASQSSSTDNWISRPSTIYDYSENE